jgi:hypothetical protein
MIEAIADTQISVRAALPLSYIGVTGFISRREVEAVLEGVPGDAARPLMVGVLVSAETLAGKPSRRRYPPVEGISDLFLDDPRVLNLIHFNGGHPNRLTEALCRLTELGGPHLHGFQLNCCWPPVRSDPGVSTTASRASLHCTPDGLASREPAPGNGRTIDSRGLRPGGGPL